MNNEPLIQEIAECIERAIHREYNKDEIEQISYALAANVVGRATAEV